LERVAESMIQMMTTLSPRRASGTLRSVGI
jgi:hypothetical protein